MIHTLVLALEVISLGRLQVKPGVGKGLDMGQELIDKVLTKVNGCYRPAILCLIRNTKRGRLQVKFK